MLSPAPVQQQPLRSMHNLYLLKKYHCSRTNTGNICSATWSAVTNGALAHFSALKGEGKEEDEEEDYKNEE